jgi:hypothetical protein
MLEDKPERKTEISGSPPLEDKLTQRRVLENGMIKRKRPL